MTPVRRATLATLLLLAPGCGPAVDVVPSRDGGATLDCPPGREQKGDRCEVKEIYFAGGTFTMGRGECFPKEAHAAEFDSGACELADEPHQVTVAPFYMDATEFVAGDAQPFYVDVDGQMVEACATMEQTEACEAAGGLLTLGMNGSVSPDQADGLLSRIEKECQKRGKTVPTEAQWEFAASGGGARLYPWGDDPPTCELVGPFDGYDSPCGPASSMVALHPPSPEGLYDLAGHYAEMVQPDPGGYSAGYEPLPLVEPPDRHWVGIRGGSMFESERTLRAAHRGTGARDGNLRGFRCVRNP